MIVKWEPMLNGCVVEAPDGALVEALLQSHDGYFNEVTSKVSVVGSVCEAAFDSILVVVVGY